MTNDYEFDLRQLILVLKRRMTLIFVTTFIFVALASAYVYFSPPKYKATTLVYIDIKTSDKISDTSSLVRTGLSEGDVLSEAEVIVSGNVIRNAVQKLGWDKGKSAVEMEGLIALINRRLKVDRLGKSYVLSVSYVSGNPREAADVANAVAASYMEEQVWALSELTKRTATWLQWQVKNLRNQAITAAKAADDYRKKYNAEVLSRKSKDRDVNIIEMQSLDREAEAYRDLHDDYLEKLKISSVQESFPVTEARIITRATPPLGKDSPKPVLIGGMATIFGVGLGVFLSLLLDNMDRSLRRIGQVRREIDVDFLGFVPRAHEKRSSFSLVVEDRQGGRRCEVRRDYESHREYINTIRTIKNEIDQALQGQKSRCIGLISSYPDRDFSFSLNLADYISKTASCVVVDVDVRGQKRIKGENLYSLKGLSDCLSTKTLERDCLIYGQDGDLAILSPGSAQQEDLIDMVTLDGVKSLIKALKEKFDYVIVNVPSLLAEAEAYSFIRNVDEYLIVARWGVTKPNDLNFSLAQNKIEKSKVIGLVLTEADMVAMKKKYGHKSSS